MASTTGVDAAPVGVQGPKDCSIPISLRSLSYFTESPVTRRTPNYEDDLFPESVWGAHRSPISNRWFDTYDQYLEYMGLKVESQRLVTAYSRVSGAAQKPDLVNQVNALERYGTSQAIQVDK